jgi:hypothetical protein
VTLDSKKAPGLGSNCKGFKTYFIKRNLSSWKEEATPG